MTENVSGKLSVLMIEDSADCAALLNHILIESKLFSQISIFSSGEEGMEYLEKEAKEKGKAFLPNLIFLDLNLPGEHGLDTLGKIKKYSEYHLIPVIVMTASDERKDLLESYRKGGAVFIRKPLEKDFLIEVLMHMKITGVLSKKYE